MPAVGAPLEGMECCEAEVEWLVVDDADDAMDVEDLLPHFLWPLRDPGLITVSCNLTLVSDFALCLKLSRSGCPLKMPSFPWKPHVSSVASTMAMSLWLLQSSLPQGHILRTEINFLLWETETSEGHQTTKVCARAKEKKITCTGWQNTNS